MEENIPRAIIDQLRQNRNIIFNLLEGTTESEYRSKGSLDEWCLLEVICHLYDEEIFDFRTRVDYALNRPGELPPPFDTIQWVKDHDYINQDFSAKLRAFFEERNKSIEWLISMTDLNWSTYFIHPKLGKMTAQQLLANWVAHDYLHMRQIIALKFKYLQKLSKEDLSYAGKW